MKQAKKSLGQNFLVDKNINIKIINLSEIKNKHIVEIGPGTGALTKEIILRRPKSLTLIEKDNELCKDLKEKYFNQKFIKIFNSDILKFEIEKRIFKNSIIFGNLPYNISSQILIKFIKFKKWPPKYKCLNFMFQKELGEKILGKYLSSEYGRLSIISNYRLKISNKFLISPNCFFPKPKVISMMISFFPKNQNLFKIKKIDNLELITNTFFSKKRKMINKSLRKILKEKEIKKIKEIKTNLRPADLKPELYYKITELFEQS